MAFLKRIGLPFVAIQIKFSSSIRCSENSVSKKMTKASASDKSMGLWGLGFGCHLQVQLIKLINDSAHDIEMTNAEGVDVFEMVVKNISIVAASTLVNSLVIGFDHVAPFVLVEGLIFLLQLCE